MRLWFVCNIQLHDEFLSISEMFSFEVHIIPYIVYNMTSSLGICNTIHVMSNNNY